MNPTPPKPLSLRPHAPRLSTLAHVSVRERLPPLPSFTQYCWRETSLLDAPTASDSPLCDPTCIKFSASAGRHEHFARARGALRRPSGRGHGSAGRRRCAASMDRSVVPAVLPRCASARRRGGWIAHASLVFPRPAGFGQPKPVACTARRLYRAAGRRWRLALQPYCATSSAAPEQACKSRQVLVQHSIVCNRNRRKVPCLPRVLWWQSCLLY